MAIEGKGMELFFVQEITIFIFFNNQTVVTKQKSWIILGKNLWNEC